MGKRAKRARQQQRKAGLETVNKKLVIGAYDLQGHWWYKKDIEVFTDGMAKMCFGTSKEDIPIVSINKKNLK